MSDQNDERKPNKVRLNVNGFDNTISQFILKDTTPLGKMMKTYCEMKGLDITLIKFLYDGKRIQNTSTAHGEEIPDNATIELFQKQDGGNFCQCIFT
nr:PREDICTED: small ubiquitin-related modifier 2-A-like [Bemisia tabaci]